MCVECVCVCVCAASAGDSHMTVIPRYEPNAICRHPQGCHIGREGGRKRSRERERDLASTADSHSEARAKSNVDARKDAKVEGLEEGQVALGLASSGHRIIDLGRREEIHCGC